MRILLQVVCGGAACLESQGYPIWNQRESRLLESNPGSPLLPPQVLPQVRGPAVDIRMSRRVSGNNAVLKAGGEEKWFWTHPKY